MGNNESYWNGLTVPEDEKFDPIQHLSFADISADDSSNPKQVAMTIKQSKTDPFCQGVTIFLGRTGTELYPVTAVLAYLAIRGRKGDKHSISRMAKH